MNTFRMKVWLVTKEIYSANFSGEQFFSAKQIYEIGLRITFVACEARADVCVSLTGLELHRGHCLQCPGRGLNGPYNCSHSSYILMEVPFTQEKWPCPYENEIPGQGPIS